MNLRCPALLCFFSSALSSFALAQDASPAIPSSGGPLGHVIQPYVEKKLCQGVVMLVADKDKVLDLESVGYSRWVLKTPMQNDDLFWIASMSKSITGAAFMMLVDEGKVSLDDPVEKYLPEFKGQQEIDWVGQDKTPHPASHPILIKEIFSHTSGIATDQQLTRDQNANGDSHDLKRQVADYAGISLRQQPGTKFEYNNAGINTAGRIIEVVSGMPYADFMQTRLFTPLGMKDTTFWPTVDQVTRLVHATKFTPDRKDLYEIDNYTSNKAGIDRLAVKVLGDKLSTLPPDMLVNGGIDPIYTYAMHYAMPAGGIYSTADDLGKFCRMLLNGGVFEGKRYLSENAIKQLTTVQTGNLYPNHDQGYAVGWEVNVKGKDLPPPGSYFHRGACSTKFWVDPADGLTFVLLTERADAWKEQDTMYQDFLKAAMEKYGKEASVTTTSTP